MYNDETDSIDLSADIIDVRTIKNRLEYLREAREELEEAAKERQENIASLEALEEPTLAQAGELEILQESLWTTEDGTELAASMDYGTDEEEEYKMLDAAENELPRDECLIAEGYFKKYAEQTAEDIHRRALRDWPFDCIDWERAADELRQDYSAIEIGGYTFFHRS